MSGEAILLFGKDPQKFFQRARIRIVRYLGDEERFGREMNVVKDVSFEGRILEMTQKAIAFVETQIKEYTFWGEDARFVTIPQYPPFCWTELIVNAVAHRDYSILGTDIMVKIFDNHYVVESPGILPGMVRIDNIRQMHFSRNPKIVEFMREYKLVKEFGEGVDRMFREMAEVGNPAPEYKQVEFMVKVRLNSSWREEDTNDIKGGKKQGGDQKKEKRPENVLENTLKKEVQLTERQDKIIKRMKEKGKMYALENVLENVLESSVSLASYLGVNERTIRRDLQFLQNQGIIRRVGPDKGGHWEVIVQGERGEKQ